MGNDPKTREELLAEIKDLRTRLEETEETLRAVTKNRNNHIQKHSKDEIQWAKNRESERAIAKGMLDAERSQHQHAEKDLYETRERLRDVSFRLLLAEEKERKRIAQEIHDGILQHWSTIKFRVEGILKDLDTHITSPLTDILPLIQVGLEESRRVQMNLRPALLDDLGIIATINWFCREFQKAYPGIQVKAEVKIQEDEVADVLKTVVYRVMQEAFNNISKHSKGNLVNLALKKKKGTLEFIIQDNGQGFDLDTVHSFRDFKSGLGLTGMKERTHLSGGSFTMESAKGEGTTIQASWPVLY
jgi:signal transduction histidine kinase